MAVLWRLGRMGVTEAGGCGGRQVTRGVVVMRSDGCRLREATSLAWRWLLGHNRVLLLCTSCECRASYTRTSGISTFARKTSPLFLPPASSYVSPCPARKLRSIFAATVTSTYVRELTWIFSTRNIDFLFVKIIYAEIRRWRKKFSVV